MDEVKEPESILRALLRLLFSSSITLFILAILFLVMTGMSQGVTIIVDLFDSWWNMLLTILMINFLALILSHFPYYFDLAIKGLDLEWKKDKKIPLFDFVYHPYSPKADEHTFILFCRRYMGVLLFIIWILILYKTKNSVFLEQENTNQSFFKQTDLIFWFVCFASVSLVIGLSLQSNIDNLKANLKRAFAKKESVDKLQNSVKIYLRLFKFVFYGTTIFLIIFIICCLSNQWSKTNLNLLIYLMYAYCFQYLLFRSTRSLFIYFTDKKNIVDTDDYPTWKLKDDFKVNVLLPFHKLASSVFYLKSMSFFGFISSAIILAVGIFRFEDLQGLNPIPLLLGLIIFYYSALVIPLKHLIYHNYKVKKEKKFINKFLRIVLIIYPIALVVSFIMMANVKNDLHTLPLVIETNNAESIITIDNFVSDLDTTKNHFYIVGSYGGGLKANAWNLFLLSRLKIQDPLFFEKTICLSGVSGGALGIANFTAQHFDSKNTNDLIRSATEVANGNYLSTDLFGWLFRDLWREVVPFDIFNGNDRSLTGMQLNSIKVGDDNKALGKSMKNYWSEVYNKSGKTYPAVIFNTTPTTSFYGVACSVEGVTFPISIDILKRTKPMENDDCSLSFFGAASTSNRFPLFSPTAHVKNVGNFVDGGYFENSGLLNALHFSKDVRSKSAGRIDSITAINIINDKALYMFDLLMENRIIEDQSYSKNHEGEFNSILNAIVALERMPRFVRNMIEEDTTVSLVNLHMPYPFDKQDVLDFLQVEVIEDDKLNLEINNLIKDNMDQINKALSDYNNFGESSDKSKNYDIENWGYVVPPLGRLIGHQAVDYQKAMVNYHAGLVNKINSLIDKE